MKASTYKAFQKLNRRISALEKKIDLLLDLADKDAGKIAADLNRAADALTTALPASAG